ncbi:hypothetical protein ACVCAH_13290 [Micromonospora sp. LZ34]
MVKFLKRQVYGRAGFALHRQRILVSRTRGRSKVRSAALDVRIAQELIDQARAQGVSLVVVADHRAIGDEPLDSRRTA